MPTCFQLVGVPGSGKSTWVKEYLDRHLDRHLDLTVVSTDNFVEAYALAQGKTYNEVFEEYMPTAVKLMTEQVIQARNQGRNIIWDQTNTTAASRRKKFKLLPDYKHIALVFQTPEPAELTRRLASRPGKHIPRRVVLQMIEGFEYPTLAEGFIWII
jgi:predicted kinase